MKKIFNKKDKPVHDLHRKDDHMHEKEIMHDLLPVFIIVIIFIIIIGIASAYGHSEANTYEHLEQIVLTKLVWRGLL